MVKYCLPIIRNTVKEVDEALAAAASAYDCFEVWLDYLDERPIETLEEWCRRLHGRLLLLFRRQGLETVRMPAAERARIMALAGGYGSYIDIDINTQQDDLRALASCAPRPPAILSYHDYSGTPETAVLESLAARMIEAKADICKLACYCNSPQDAIRLLAVQQQLLARGVRHLVLGMGRFGAATRIFGTLWGNEFVFAPAEHGQESAPGQLTRPELERIFEALGEV